MDAIAARGVAIGREVAPFASRALAIGWRPTLSRLGQRRSASERVAFDLGELPCALEVAAIWSHARAFASRDGAMRSRVQAIGLEGGVDRRPGAACRPAVVAIRLKGRSFDPGVGASIGAARMIRREALPIRPEEMRSGLGGPVRASGVAPNRHLRRTTCPLLASRVGRR